MANKRLLNSMKYKGYTFPYNPTNLSIDYGKKIIEHDYPGIDYSNIEELGLEGRAISGKGVFYGPNAYNNFLKLLKVYREKTPGNLIHPKFGSMYCHFIKLKSIEEPLPNFVEYEFEFKEVIAKKKTNTSNSSSGGTPSKNNNKSKYYVIKKGDTLWEISKKFYGKGSEWKKIANANKKIIKNPNKIYPGVKIYIP